MNSLRSILILLLLAGVARAQSMSVPDHVHWNDPRLCRLDGASGSFISLGGQAYIISCAHESNVSFQAVGRTVEAEFHDGAASPSQIVSRTRNYDLTIWRMARPPSDVACFPIAATDPQPGEYVTIAGFPMMQNLRPRRVRVSGKAFSGCPKPGSLMCETTEAIGGESGAAVVNDQGELAGVFWGAMGAGPGQPMYACFTPASNVRRFLAEMPAGRLPAAAEAERVTLCQCGPGGCNYGPSYGGGYYIQQPQYRPPQYRPPVQPIPQPQTPIQPPTVTTPTPTPIPTPTIDEDALAERIRLEIAANIQASIHNEISVLVKNEVAARGGECGCGTKWLEWEGWRVDVNSRLNQIQADINAINIAIANIKIEQPAPGGPAAPAEPQYYYQIGPHKN